MASRRTVPGLQGLEQAHVQQHVQSQAVVGGQDRQPEKAVVGHAPRPGEEGRKPKGQEAAADAAQQDVEVRETQGVAHRLARVLHYPDGVRVGDGLELSEQSWNSSRSRGT